MAEQYKDTQILSPIPWPAPKINLLQNSDADDWLPQTASLSSTFLTACQGVNSWELKIETPFCIYSLHECWASPSKGQWNGAWRTLAKNLAPKTSMKMKRPIETWHLCFSKADWSHLAAYPHENWEAHSIHYLYWQIPTFGLLDPPCTSVQEGIRTL